MINYKKELKRIIIVEFNKIVKATEEIDSKYRFYLIDNSYIDIWISETIENRFGFHYERSHLDNKIYRYDNYPNTEWKHIKTFPYHFHNGSQENVEEANFSKDIIQGFYEFLSWINEKFFIKNK